MKYKLSDILDVTLDTLQISKSEWGALNRYRVAGTIMVKQYVSLIALNCGYKHIEIGHFFNAHRTTIIHHINTMRDLLHCYQEKRDTMDAIMKNLSQYDPIEKSIISHSWLARTQKGILTISPTKPEQVGCWWIAEGSRIFNPQDAFPQITWESGPVRVRTEITIEDND